MIRRIRSLKLKSGEVYTVGDNISAITEATPQFFLRLEGGVLFSKLWAEHVESVEYENDKPSDFTTILEDLRSSLMHLAASQMRIEDVMLKLKGENDGG